MMASIYKIDQKKESSDRCKKNTKEENPRSWAVLPTAFEFATSTQAL
jgi:hypothetical protein